MIPREFTPHQSHPRPDDVAQRGDAIYEQHVEPRLGADDEGKFVVIDVDTGAYEIDADEVAAFDRLLARQPHANIWLRRIGSPYARRFGPRRRTAA